jgi:hypothetical protein
MITELVPEPLMKIQHVLCRATQDHESLGATKGAQMTVRSVKSFYNRREMIASLTKNAESSLKKKNPLISLSPSRRKTIIKTIT